VAESLLTELVNETWEF